MRSLFAELKRRDVLRAGAFYAAAAWLLVQVATQVFPFFDMPNWTVRWIVIAAAIGFPFALLFAWFYEWTPEGFVRESDDAGTGPAQRAGGKKLDRWIIATLSLAVVLLLTNQFVRHRDAASPPALASERSIAVLPLANASGDKDEQYFSDGLSEDLINALSQFAGLKVIGRNSSFQFRDSKDDSRTIAGKLGVAHLLEGSVRREGDVVRIRAELVDAADGSTRWSEHYDRPYKDLFKLQDDITAAVAHELEAKLLATAGAVIQSDRPPSGNLEAYSAYLQAKFHMNRISAADSEKADEYLQDCIRLDPNYAQAFALMAVHAALRSQSLAGADARKAFADAHAAAAKALALEPELAYAHNATGFVKLLLDFDWSGAQAAYRRAARLAPNDAQIAAALAETYAMLGHPEQAVDAQRRALPSDSLNAGLYLTFSQNLMALGRLDEAEQAIRAAIEAAPDSSGMREQLVTIQVMQGKAAAALNTASKAPPGRWHDVALADALQIGADKSSADDALQTLIDKHAETTAFPIAEIYALRHDPDRMFAWLDRAWTNRDANLVFLLVDPFVLRYRDDPRFAAFCARVGLPATTTAQALP